MYTSTNSENNFVRNINEDAVMNWITKTNRAFSTYTWLNGQLDILKSDPLPIYKTNGRLLINTQKFHAERRAVYGQFSNCIHAYR